MRASGQGLYSSGTNAGGKWVVPIPRMSPMTGSSLACRT
jgi:hypothetical protein